MLQHLSEHTENEEGLVDSSGLLERDWYRAKYPEVCDRSDPIAHFCREGWRRGFQPNPYFDPGWYSKTYGNEFLHEESPLLHYIRRGERENAWPSPHFDPEWYRDEYAIDEHESPLRHYLVNRARGTFAPLPSFDPVAYAAARPGCIALTRDPYLHWLRWGDPAPSVEWTLATVLDLVGGSLTERSFPETVSGDAFRRVLQLFIPFIPFDETSYCLNYPDVAKAVQDGLIPSAHWHFIEHGFMEGRSPGSARRYR